MTESPHNPIGILAAIVRRRLLEEQTDWVGKPLEEIKKLSGSSIGIAGEDFVEEMLLSLGYEIVDRKMRGEYDFKIRNIRLEIKTATLDGNGSFQFNGIRYDKKYDVLMALGIAPSQIFFRFWRIKDLHDETLVRMAKDTNSAFKLTKKPESLLEISEFSDEIARIVGDAT